MWSCKEGEGGKGAPGVRSRCRVGDRGSGTEGCVFAWCLSDLVVWMGNEMSIGLKSIGITGKADSEPLRTVT